MQDTQKQQRLDELLLEYNKKNTLLQILPVPYFKTGTPRKVVLEKKRVWSALEKEVQDLKVEISEVFYGGEGL